MNLPSTPTPQASTQNMPVTQPSIQGGSPHADALFSLAMQQPPGSPDKYNLLSMASRFHQSNQAAQQNLIQQNPADAYVVKAPDGQAYLFPTAEAASQFKQKTASLGEQFQGDVQSIASPFLRTGVSFFNAGAAGGAAMAGDQQGIGQELNKPRDLGYFGTVQPFASSDHSSMNPLAPSNLNSFTDAAKAGFEGGATVDMAASLPGLVKSLPQVFSKAPTLTNFLKPTVEGTAPEDVFSAAKIGTSKLTTLRSTLEDEMGSFSNALAEQFPDTKIVLNASQVADIQAAAQSARIALPDFMKSASKVTLAGEDLTTSFGTKVPALELDIAQARELGTALNRAWEKGMIEPVYNDLRSTITDQLNQAHPGLGTVYDQMYLTAHQGYQALDTASKIFDSTNKTLDPDTLLQGIERIQRLAADPQGQPILNAIVQRLKEQGVDLSQQVNAISAVQKIKDPLAKRAAKILLKLHQKGSLVRGGAIVAHDLLR